MLFSVNVTTVVVTAGEAVTVNCSQTGYIRSQWRWRRNGINIPTSSSERVYTKLSARSKVGSFTGNTVDNHQSLFLHLWHSRVMDNGVYICVTETDAQNVFVDVQPPGRSSNCTHVCAHTTLYAQPYMLNLICSTLYDSAIADYGIMRQYHASHSSLILHRQCQVQ